MTHFKLNNEGFSHVLALGLVLIVSGVIGTYTLVSSSAASKSGSIKVSGIAYKCQWAGGEASKCHYVKSKASLWVGAGADEAQFRQNLACNGKKIPVKDFVNLGPVRSLKCKPGAYELKLDDPTAYDYKTDAKKSAVVQVRSGHKSTVRLGSNY